MEATGALIHAEFETWRRSSTTPKELSSEISRLPKRAPITAELQVALGGIETRGFNDAEHFNPKNNWIVWLESYKGPYPRRKDWNHTAGFVYNHLLVPSMVLWLGEASGVSKKLVRRALNAANTVQPNRATQSAAIRKIIPWKVIEEQLGAPNRKSSREQS
jgi:hypothetical protein